MVMISPTPRIYTAVQYILVQTDSLHNFLFLIRAYELVLQPFLFKTYQIHVTCSNVLHEKQEAQLMLTDERDAFRGQSRSPNVVPFDRLGMVSYYSSIVTLSLKRTAAAA